MAEQERTPRTYADLLALYDAAPVWEPPAVDPATAVAAGAAPVDRLAYATEEEIARALEIDVLGRTEAGDIEVYSEHYRRTTTFGGIARMKYSDLLLQFGPPVKATVLKSGQDSVPGMWSLAEVRDAISLLGGARLIGDETKLGAGCWPVVDEAGQDQQAVVLVNAREAMHFNGTIARITHPRHRGHLLSFESGAKPWYDHDQLTALLGRACDQQFRVETLEQLRELFGRWRWRGERDPLIVSGLVLATWVQAMWAWRPRIDILGASNTGKSMLCAALAGLFRDIVILTSDTTAAGLRQKIRNSAAVVIVDEVDAKNRSKVARQREILEMLRSASRGTAAIRGTGSGKAQEFTLRHLVWVAGISLNYDDQADRNRAVLLNLHPPKADMAGKLRLPTSDELHDLGQRSLAVALWCVQQARGMAVRLKDVRLDGVDQRLIESYAVPAATIGCSLGMDDDGAVGLLRSILSDARQDTPVEADETTLVADILGANVQLDRWRLTVGQAIEHVLNIANQNRDEWRKALEGVGVKIDYSGVTRLVLRYQAIRSKLLHTTRWAEQSIDQYLRRIRGPRSEPKTEQHRVGGSKGRCIVFDMDEFREMFMGTDGQQELAQQAQQTAGQDAF
jgi:hypothetical protein